MSLGWIWTSRLHVSGTPSGLRGSRSHFMACSSTDRLQGRYRIQPVDLRLARVAGHRGLQLQVNGRAPCHDVSSLEELLASIQIGYDAPGLPDHQHPGADVPGRQAELEEAVVDASGG